MGKRRENNNFSRMSKLMLALLLILTLIIPQNTFGYEFIKGSNQLQVINSTTNNQNYIYYIDKNGVKQYYNSNNVKIASSSNNSTVNNISAINSKSTNSNLKTKNKKKGLLKKELENYKSNVVNNYSNNDIKNIALKNKIKKRPSSVQGELIIKFKDGVKQEAKNNIYQKYSLNVKKKLDLINASLVSLPENVSTDTAINKLKSEPDVEFVQPNYIYYPDSLTTDPLSDQQWGLENNGQLIQGVPGINDIDIDAKDAWNITEGSGQVVIGVIDTGVDINHPDLKDKIWTNPGEIPNNGIDDDGDGYIDDVHGWDFYNNDNTVFDAQDGDEHGTHVSGTIAASLNTIGVVGVAPNVKIMPLKFIGPNGGTTSDAILAIEYAKKMGVKITNNSWGGSSYDEALKQAIEQSGILFVVAAGNDSENNDDVPSYPASYDCQNIISVAAIDNRGELAPFSNYGPKSVDVAAPGVAILSTVPKKPYIGAAIYSDTGTYL